MHARGAHELGIFALVTRHQLLTHLHGRLVKLLLLLLLLVIQAAINIHHFSFVEQLETGAQSCRVVRVVVVEKKHGGADTRAPLLYHLLAGDVGALLESGELVESAEQGHTRLGYVQERQAQQAAEVRRNDGRLLLLIRLAERQLGWRRIRWRSRRGVGGEPTTRLLLVEADSTCSLELLRASSKLE